MKHYLVSGHLDEYERVVDFRVEDASDSLEAAEAYIHSQEKDNSFYFVVWTLDSESRQWTLEYQYHYDGQKQEWVRYGKNF